MVICCVPLCKSRSDRGCNIDEDGNKITFHEFPSDETRKTAWLIAIKRQGENPKTLWRPKDKADRSVVCSKHFTAEDFKAGLKVKILKSTAVPSVFPDYLDHERKIHLKSRKIDKKDKSQDSSSESDHFIEMENMDLLSLVCSQQEPLKI